MSWKNAVMNPPKENGKYWVGVGYVEDGIIKEINMTYVGTYYTDSGKI